MLHSLRSIYYIAFTMLHHCIVGTTLQLLHLIYCIAIFHCIYYNQFIELHLLFIIIVFITLQHQRCQRERKTIVIYGSEEAKQEENENYTNIKQYPI